MCCTSHSILGNKDPVTKEPIPTSKQSLTTLYDHYVINNRVTDTKIKYIQDIVDYKSSECQKKFCKKNTVCKKNTEQFMKTCNQDSTIKILVDCFAEAEAAKIVAAADKKTAIDTCNSEKTTELATCNTEKTTAIDIAQKNLNTCNTSKTTLQTELATCTTNKQTAIDEINTCHRNITYKDMKCSTPGTRVDSDSSNTCKQKCTDEPTCITWSFIKKKVIV